MSNVCFTSEDNMNGQRYVANSNRFSAVVNAVENSCDFLNGCATVKFFLQLNNDTFSSRMAK